MHFLMKYSAVLLVLSLQLKVFLSLPLEEQLVAVVPSQSNANLSSALNSTSDAVPRNADVSDTNPVSEQETNSSSNPSVRSAFEEIVPSNNPNVKSAVETPQSANVSSNDTVPVSGNSVASEVNASASISQPVEARSAFDPQLEALNANSSNAPLPAFRSDFSVNSSGVQQESLSVAGGNIDSEAAAKSANLSYPESRSGFNLDALVSPDAAGVRSNFDRPILTGPNPVAPPSSTNVDTLPGSAPQVRAILEEGWTGAPISEPEPPVNTQPASNSAVIIPYINVYPVEPLI